MEGHQKQRADEVKIKDLMARLIESTKSSNKNDANLDGGRSSDVDTGEERRSQTDGKETSEIRSDVEAVSRVTDREAKLIGMCFISCLGNLSFSTILT